ncbi:hypothetical protein [Brevundimonas balnearis]|uniref:Uncharacterized protein n=1 Tax=Brevundimonas balnearis TaxID=1572858 RepID=A0ABV6R4K4_9CAUL
MALLHPADRAAADPSKPHPALCFFTGLGVIFAGGLGIHLLFRLIF